MTGRHRQSAASGGRLTFNDDVFRRPLLVESGEAGVLADTHHVLSEVKLLRVEAQQTQPQLPHRLGVAPQLWPTAGLNTDASSRWCRAHICSFVHTVFTKLQNAHECFQVIKEIHVPAVDQHLRFLLPIINLKMKTHNLYSDILCINVDVEFSKENAEL